MYSQSRDHSTGGSHHSSDRGSNSTSGEAFICSIPVLHVNEANGPSVLTLMFAFSQLRESQSKERNAGPEDAKT